MLRFDVFLYATQILATWSRSMEQVTAVYTGRVQGVFFRATVRKIASGHAVTGWVRNESDGSVRLVAEGERDAIDAFLEAIRIRFAMNIESEEITRTDKIQDLVAFEIR